MDLGSAKPGPPTAYEILAVHPSAPAELLSVAYWMTVEEIQTARQSGLPLDNALHVVTRAYEKVSRPEIRAGYNLSIGHATESLATRTLPGARLPFTRPAPRDQVDHYEVLGLHETAPAELVSEAYRVMHAVYARLPVPDNRRARLLALLELAHSTIGDARSRSRYDLRRNLGRGQPGQEGTYPFAGFVASMIRALSPWSRSTGPAFRASMLERLSLYLE